MISQSNVQVGQAVVIEVAIVEGRQEKVVQQPHPVVIHAVVVAKIVPYEPAFTPVSFLQLGTGVRFNFAPVEWKEDRIFGPLFVYTSSFARRNTTLSFNLATKSSSRRPRHSRFANQPGTVIQFTETIDRNVDFLSAFVDGSTREMASNQQRFI